MKNLIALLVLGLVFTSCATYTGSVSSNIVEGNVQYTDVAYGVAKTTQFFGLGGQSKDALVLIAKKNLMNYRPLKPNEQYINYTVDIKRSYLTFYIKTIATVSADVVLIAEEKPQDLYSAVYLTKIAGVKLNNGLFEVGDSVLIKGQKPGQILSVINPEKVKVSFANKKGGYLTKDFSVDKIYSTAKEYKGQRVGAYTTVTHEINGENKLISSTVVGLGLKGMMVLTSEGRREFVDYEN